MSFELIKDIIVKEEYKVEECSVDVQKRLFSDDFNDTKSKCGEVFWGHRGGDFTFVCVQCQRTFTDLPSFGEHIRDENPLYEIETLPATFHDDAPVPKLEPPDEDESDFGLHGEEHEGASCDADDQTDEDSSKSKTGTFCCYSCGAIFALFKSYRIHYRYKHPDMIENDGLSETSFVPKIPQDMLCKFCLKTFNDTTAYHSHAEHGHLNKLYTCPYCPKYFPRRSDRNRHVDRHEGKKRHKCPHCTKAFTLASHLRDHINTHLKVKPFSCRFCDNKFTQKGCLQRHEQSHADERPLRCIDCSLNFNDERLLELHMRQHTNKKTYNCPHCDKAFHCSTFLEEHILMHRNGRPFSCDIEEHMLTNDENLQDVHEENQAESDSEHYATREAEITEMEVSTTIHDANSDDRVQSEESDAGNSKQSPETFCCYSCGIIFVVFESYRIHYRNEHADMIENDDCAQDASDQSSFVPKVPNEMLCKYCLQTFNEPSTYHSHLKNAHLNKLYICPQCPKTFSQKFYRNRHVDAHADKKLHKCPHCPKAFTTSNNLQVHVNIHLNIKRFACRFCTKKFVVKSNMQRHELIHTAERTFVCNECDLKFRDKRQLDRHVQKHMK